jgi:sugar phosphate isomerase/epimerase
MAFPRLALAVIGDEVGPSLAEMISFCAENGVRRLDMRTVEGRNLLGMTVEEVCAIKRTLAGEGIEVPTFVSPLLKWASPGKQPAGGKVDFAFDPKECPAADPFVHAFEIASALAAGRMRLFSYLRYEGYHPLDLRPELERLLALAERHDVVLELENEPVCNVGSIAELAAFFRVISPSSHLRPLVDIGNSWSMGLPPADADIATLAPATDQIHLKDRDLKARRIVPLGDGDVPWANELRRLLGGVAAAEVVASMETHCPQDGRNATARSVAALRRIAGEIGVELV